MKSLEMLGRGNSKPMRFIKREILLDCQMPIDTSITTFDAPSETDALVVEVRERAPCLIVLSLPGPYHLPPFYSVNSDLQISRRDIDDVPPPATIDDLSEELRQLPARTLVDVVDPLWADDVVAARLMYVDDDEQYLEAGLLCQPREIGLPGAGPSIHVHLRDFLAIDVDSTSSPASTGLVVAVAEILQTMSRQRSGLRKLAQLGSMPTLEMAYHPVRGTLIIDVDWPLQWADESRQDSEGGR